MEALCGGAGGYLAKTVRFASLDTSKTLYYPTTTETGPARINPAASSQQPAVAEQRSSRASSIEHPFWPAAALDLRRILTLSLSLSFPLWLLALALSLSGLIWRLCSHAGRRGKVVLFVCQKVGHILGARRSVALGSLAIHAIFSLILFCYFLFKYLC